MTEASNPTAPDAKKKEKRKMPMRENLEAFGIAILMAVVLKFFAIEAYQIPTSSMQPTMMGTTTGGVYDRLVVDKLRYEIFDPERWDIVVFRYPIRQSQSYVKRLVGLPKDRLWIAGGNIYTITTDAEDTSTLKPEDLQVQRKPDLLQEHIWKNVFPYRYELNESDEILNRYFHGSPPAAWSEDEDGVLVLKPRSPTGRNWLRFTNRSSEPLAMGGLVDHFTDGYDVDVARTMLLAGEPRPELKDWVQDARLSFTLTPSAQVSRVELRIQITTGGGMNLAFAFEVENGDGRIVVTKNGKEVLAGEPTPVSIVAGSSNAIAFAHVDDRCHAWFDGELVATLDTDEFKLLQQLSSSNGNSTPVVASLGIQSGGEVAVGDIAIDRDLHYLPSSERDPYRHYGRIIEVPDGHYFMMGDNTQQSIDSRDWTAITVGVIDGRIVDPRKHPEAERLVGNMRARPVDTPPDADENPVIIARREDSKVVFENHLGEVFVLDGQISDDLADGHTYGVNERYFFKGDSGPWEGELSSEMFVRREHILGRALLNFFPLGSFTGPFRLGFIR